MLMLTQHILLRSCQRGKQVSQTGEQLLNLLLAIFQAPVVRFKQVDLLVCAYCLLAANLTPSLGRKLFGLSGPQMRSEPWKLSISLEIGLVMVGGYRPQKQFLTEKISMQMVLLEFKAKNLDSFDWHQVVPDTRVCFSLTRRSSAPVECWGYAGLSEPLPTNPPTQP